MTLFCLLWMPLFYFFRVSLDPKKSAASGGVWALLLGSVAAVMQFFLGDLVHSGGFGLSRWVSALVDIIALPVLLPFAVCALLSFFKVLSGSPDLTNFALLWLIPGGMFRAVSWSAQHEPSLLVLSPLLWTALAVGLPLFITIILDGGHPLVGVPAALGALALLLAATSASWAFFSQRALLAFALCAVAMIPACVSIGMDLQRAGRFR
ncbi:hypothetical protein FACS1894142_2050 [Spirochaetia bacterium]|nr:hypothetical protein FACS1894142_2050 [Spirochaetia bacterium]